MHFKDKKRTGIGLFTILIGISLFTIIRHYSLRLDNLEQDKNIAISDEISFKYNTVNFMKKKIEEQARHQMRLNLTNATKGMEKFIKEYQVNMLDRTERKKVIQIFTNYMKYYDSEGNTFVVNTLGEFEFDDDNDCGQPVSLLNPGVPLINLPNRARTYMDEIVWQYELMYVLYSQGLINYIDKDILKYATEKIHKVGNYEVDEELNSINIYDTRDVEYIERNYPEVFNILKTYNIVMHSDYHLVEPVLHFFSKHHDSTEKTHLTWQFNDYPYREILEIKWIPSEKIGFHDETRSFAGGSLNPDYLRIGIVQGAQIQKIIDEYEPIFKGIENQANKNIEVFEKLYKEEKKRTLLFAWIVVILFIVSTISVSTLILHKKE